MAGSGAVHQPLAAQNVSDDGQSGEEFVAAHQTGHDHVSGFGRIGGDDAAEGANRRDVIILKSL